MSAIIENTQDYCVINTYTTNTKESTKYLDVMRDLQLVIDIY
jgi:hypothetical protein